MLHSFLAVYEIIFTFSLWFSLFFEDKLSLRDLNINISSI